MSYNIPFIREVRDYVLDHPDEWNQDHWAAKLPGCGTTMCIAGTACHLAGLEFRFEKSRLRPTERADRLTDGSWVEHRAAVLMGLQDDEAHALFHTYDHDKVLKHLNCIIETAQDEPAVV